MNVAQIIERNARRIPQRPAVISEMSASSWQEFNLQINRLGNALHRLGVTKGDRVAICLPNSLEYLVTYFAVIKLGAIAVPFNVMFTNNEINYIVNNSEAKVLVAAPVEGIKNLINIRDNIPGLEHIVLLGSHEALNILEYSKVIARETTDLELADCSPDDVASIIYTSGTTGHPKGAMLTHGNLYYNGELNGCYALHINDQDSLLTGTPLCHAFSVLTVMGPMYRGAAVVTMPRFFPDQALELMSRFKVTHFAGVPTMYLYMLQAYQAAPEKYDLLAWRYAQSAGAAMPAEHIARIEETFGVNFCEYYGATETSATCTYGRLGHGKPGSVGPAADTWEVKIMDEQNREVPVNEVGEIVVRGPGVFKGYWKMPEATAEAFTDGWYHTSDLGRVDEDGHFYIVDRKKDMLICGGYNIYPRELEEILYTHPAILEAAVVGIPDALKGEIPKAFIVLRSGMQAGEAEVIGYCRERLAAFKIPRGVEFLKELPKNSTGKILKRVLRDRFGQG